MQKKYHYISGLPRSGSTALVSILRQNPNFFADVSDSLASHALAGTWSGGGPGARTMNSDTRIRNMIIGMFDGYYKEIDKPIIFNTNRFWTQYIEYLYQINDNFRIICCVRDYKWILNSFEKLYKSRNISVPQNTYIYNGSNSSDNVLTVWHRTHFLANESFVRANYNYLKEAYYGPYRKHLLFVEYDDLTKNPNETMKRIYDFIEEPFFEHDFNNIEFAKEEYDIDIMAPGLHQVRKKLVHQPGEQVLPPDLWEQYSNWEFWR